MTCTCKAYKFPHRELSGKCFAKEDGPFCGACGKPCKAITVDEGIGAYEYWGQKGVDTCIVTSSDCCEADVFSDASLQVNYEKERDHCY